MQQSTNREQWGSKLGFILAAAGSAIGLGNIWRFPYLAGENGGAAFIFVYLICVFAIGIPVLIAEILIGRSTQKDPVAAFKALTKSRLWPLVGGMGILAGFVIFTFYSVVAGWSLGYVYEAITGNFLNYISPSSAGNHFNDLTSSIAWTVGLHAAFVILTMAVVYFGIQKGIERGSKIMMPALFLFLLIAMIQGLTLDGASAGLNYLFNPDFSKITTKVVLAALGQAFFSLSLGMGAMLTYGSYLSKKDNIPSSATWIALLDTSVAIVAGIAIFTAVFSTGQSPAEGPSLIFRALPAVLTQIPGGYIFSIFFFIALALAALTSTVSLLEVVITYFIGSKGWPRKKAVIVFGLIALIIGIPSALSTNAMANATLFGKTFFGLTEFLASNLMLPIGGFFISIFVAWFWDYSVVRREVIEGSESLFGKLPWMLSGWRFIIRYVAPILILIVFLSSLGII